MRTTTLIAITFICGASILLTSCYTQLMPLSKGQSQSLLSEVKKLSNSTLIIRLYTNNPKRRVLQDYDQSKALEAHDADRQEYASTMISTWEEHYNFSDVLYIPDSLFLAFQEGANRPLFLNSALELDPSITLETKDYYVLARGSRDYAFKWLDSNLEPLIPQPPINYDKLSLWELLQGRDQVLADRVESTDAYFNKLVAQ